MEKNNKKYLIFSVILLIASIYLNYITFYLNTIYIYEKFDVTGVAQIVQRIMTVIILIISVIVLIKSIKAREEGVDFLFNEVMISVFVIYMLLSIITYIYVRNTEEKTAINMKNEIETYGEKTAQNQLKKNNTKNKNSFEKDFYNILSDALAESEYASSDKYYDRKKEIIDQVENSSTVKRYISMLFYNYLYDDYGSIMTDEIEYYGIFSKFMLIGLIGAIFYFSKMSKLNQNVIMEDFWDRKE